MSDIIWANTIFPWFMISVFCNTICKSTKSLSQICRSLKRKNDITRCVSTCYVVISCGGRTRTCDLQVMSLASYQLLHSAILTIAIRLTIEVFLNCECKGMTFYWNLQMFLQLFFENDAKRLKNNAEKLKSDAGRLKNRAERLKSDAGKPWKLYFENLLVAQFVQLMQQF